MNNRVKKGIAALQIALQLLPPLYFIPAFASQPQDAPAVSDRPAGQEQADDGQRVAQTAIQAGTALESGDVASSLLSTATGAAASSVQAWLNQFGTARVSLSTDDRFSLLNSELDILLPLYDQKNNLLFTQLGARRVDDRNILNAGLGYRHFFDQWMWGTNLFYDRQLSTNHHQRLGVGAELGWDYFKLAANGYVRLTNWQGAATLEDYDERAANGFDIHATGYLPAWPQLGASVMYEQYFGNNVGLAGNDEDDLQQDPYAVTFGLSYTPVPLLTLGVNQKFGKRDKNDTQLSLAMSWTPGVPLGQQLDPAAVAQRRSLKGSRQDLVDRNNTIVLDYRKQTLITLSLPPLAEGNALSQHSLSAEVKSKHGLDRLEWQASSFTDAGGKITPGSSPEQFTLTLPDWRATGVNSYTLQATAWDRKGNTSGTGQMTVNVNGVDVTALQSVTVVSPDTLPADGASQATVSVTLHTRSGEKASGLASRLTTALIPTGGSAGGRPDVARYHESTPGVYTATLTAGTRPDTYTVQPLIDDTIKLAPARLVAEAAQSRALLGELDVSATRAPADGVTPLTLTAHVTDGDGRPLKEALIDWLADNPQAHLSASQTATDADGVAQVQVTSAGLIDTVISAQLKNGAKQSSPVLHFTADISSASVASVTSEKTQVVANNNDTSTVTAQVTDGAGHPVSDVTVNWAVNRTDGGLVAEKTAVSDESGIATLALKSSKTGSVTVTAHVTGTAAQVTAPITFVADSSSQKVSALTPSKTRAIANGTDAIIYEAIVTDAAGNALPDAPVDWSASNDDVHLSSAQTLSDAEGKAQVSATSLKSGRVVVSARVNGGTAFNAAEAIFTADAATTQMASLQADKTTGIVADVDTVTLVATVLDAGQNPVPDVTVNWSSSEPRSGFSAPSSVTDAQGQARITFSSLRAGEIDVTASAGGSGQTQHLQVTGNAATAKMVTLTADKARAVADGSSPVSWRTVVTDANDNPLENVDVSWTTNNADVTLSDASGKTDANGEASVSGTALKAGSLQLTAALTASGGSLTAAEVTFIADAKTARVASLSPGTSVAVVGTTRVTYTAEITDANANPLENVSVAWQTTLNTLSGQSSTTNAEGKATVQLSGTNTGNATVTATIDGASLENDSVRFIASYVADWNITSNSSTYRSPALMGFPSLGFIAAGGTTGPTRLEWAVAGVSELTTQMQDENGQTWTVKFGGQRTSGCSSRTFNSAATCQSWESGYSAQLSFNKNDNPGLPAGNYHGVIEFAGKDWHTSWALSYVVTTALTVK